MSKPIKKLADLAKEALDMSKEARMARAAEMGFDTEKVFYRGLKTPHSDDAKTMLRGGAEETWLISNPKMAGEYAGDAAGANVVPAHLGLENPMVHDLNASPVEDLGEIVDEAKSSGHDGLILKGFDHRDEMNRVYSKGTAAVVFDKSKIRSTNAKFDPKKKGSGNILDSLGPIAVGGLVAAGMSSEDAQAVILKVNPLAKDVKTVEELLKVAQEQRLLHHATTKKAIESIAEGGLEPGVGKIVKEAYSETLDALKGWENRYGAEIPDDVAFLSDTPAGYFAKWQIEANSKTKKSVGINEIQKSGGMGLFPRDESIYRLDPQGHGGPDGHVLQSVDESKMGDYPSTVPHWVEPGDFFTNETQRPDYIVTGKELKQYLQKADPNYNVYADGKYPNVEGFAEQHNLPPKSNKGKKVAAIAGAATLAASNDALAADLNSPVASGMGEVASQAGHAMERFDAYTSNPFRKFLNSALEGKGIIQSAREGVQAFGAEKPTTGEEVAKNFLSLSPNQNLGFPTADGGKDYPLAGPLGVAVDFAVDPTNIPMAKAVGPGMDAASSISRIIEQSLLKRGLVLP